MTIEYKPLSGEFIGDCAKNAIIKAQTSGRQVYFIFNDKKVYVNPWDDIGAVVARFNKERYNEF